MHLESARRLARSLHEANISLVYGGGTHGLMGELARTVVSLSGSQNVHGVIPRALISIDPKFEQAANQSQSGSKRAEMVMSAAKLEDIDTGQKAGLLQESEYGRTIVVSDMHTRKRTMADMVIKGGPGSGFVALAGGYGTIEEVMEMVTWNQLGIHRMPIVLVNIDGYWDGLLQWVSNAVKQGYVAESAAGIMVEVKDTGEVLNALKEYRLAQGRYKLNWSQGNEG